MAISSRQAELFAGESWTSLYQRFAQVNFNASDPITINQALQNYIRVNYPEAFNDWIVSSEFVALIDLLSWLAGTLAFKTDIAARENFIDTAEARESILRLARFLSYNPSRCQPATGVLKLVSVSSDDDVYDSFGNDLANSTILWNDSQNPNWAEQFAAVLNGALVPTNPIGIPLKNGTVAGVQTQLYRMNNIAANSSYAFATTVSGIGANFEVCNGDFTNGGVLFERPPNPLNAFHFYYLNDGQGNSSGRTGFFLLFKQGSTQTSTFSITVPIENQTLDLDSVNVNAQDVWVQTVDDNGNVAIDWVNVAASAISSIATQNISFNDVPAAQRNIFSVITRDNDQITIRFSDGRFGNAPIGNIRVTYRISNGLSYQIKPLEINNISLRVSYVNQLGTSKTLTMTFSLYENVANASVAETVEQIRQRAPQVYATQNRMVSGEDYNVLPLSTNLAAKIKAVNRVYSGQSRYIDLGDPTGTYQDLALFAEDGIIFADPRNTYIEVPSSLNLTPNEVVSNYILPTLDQYTVANLISDVLMQGVLNGSITATSNTWNAAGVSLFETSGWFTFTDSLIQPGAIVQFLVAGKPIWAAVSGVQGVINQQPIANTAGPVTLSQEVPTGSTVIAVLPSYTVLPSSDLINTMIDNVKRRISFSLYYDYANGGSIAGPRWWLGPALNDFGPPPPTMSDAISNDGHATQLLIMTVNYRASYVGQDAAGGLWQISALGLSYVFESINDIAWFDNGQRGLAQLTGESVRDNVRVLRINRDLSNPAGYALPIDYNFAIDRLWLYPDGTEESRRATVLFADSNLDGYPDAPDAFYRLIGLGLPYALTVPAASGNSVLTVGSTAGIRIGQIVRGAGIASGTQVTSLASSLIGLSLPTTATINTGSTVLIDEPVNNYLFWSNLGNPPYDTPLFTVRGYDSDTQRIADTPAAGTVGFQASATSYLDDETFWVYTGDEWQQDVDGVYRFERGRGPNIAVSWLTAAGDTLTPQGDALAFHWTHVAPSDHRIDPAVTNCIDVFALPFSYDVQVRQWIAGGADPTNVPTPPTELDLRLSFASMEAFKMFSDQLIWRPVRYKFLFGKAADAELRAQFKVVRLPSAAVSDGEIKTRIISAINAYFAVSNFDFGETFYFTELAAYVHQQLAGLIGSVVLVPLAADASFGDGFEVSCRPDEIFISVAQVADIVLIPSNTAINLRIRN